MENNSKKFIKKFKRIICMTIAMVIVFVECFSHIGVIKSKAANTTPGTDVWRVRDSEKNTFYYGDTCTIRKKSANFTISPPDGIDDADKLQYEWISLDTEYITVTQDPTRGEIAKLTVIKPREAVSIDIRVYKGDKYITTFTFSVCAPFSISEELSNVSGVSIHTIFDDDDRGSIIMETDSTLMIGNDKSKLSLVYGNPAIATWTSLDDDIIDVDNDTKEIKAVGAGVTKLRVDYIEGLSKYYDIIDVYVRPKLKFIKSNNNVIENPEEQGEIGAKKGDKIQVNVNTKNDFDVTKKIAWVIEKDDNGNGLFVRDSYGHTGTDANGNNLADDANLVYESSSKSYRLDCKAGVYKVYFCVNGTYKYDKEPPYSDFCEPVTVTVRIDHEFKAKDVTISIGGSYNLTDALNIPLGILQKNFDFNPVDNESSSKVDVDKSNFVIKAKDVGSAKVSVKKTSDKAISGININKDDEIIININIVNKFSLDRSTCEMAVDETIDLRGVIEPDTTGIPPSQFKWSSNDPLNCIDLFDEIGRNASVRANRPGSATVTLEWTNSDGIVQSASCYITVYDSANKFTIVPDNDKIEVGKSTQITSSIKDPQDIVWMSSDTKIATVVANPNNITATVTAGSKTGDVVITAYNPKNKAYATCKVTVISSITSLKIDKGDAYTASLASQYVFLKAVYQPNNATETEMEWISTNEKVATVDKNGMVTMLSKGETTIQVKPVYNPNSLMATCILTVTDRVMDSIKTDVTNLDMIKGQTRQVVATYTPADASETSMTWTSLDTKVAKVSNTGLITAVGVGTTNIVVKANVAYDTTNNPNKFAEAVITVNVRNKLNSIKFASAPIYIAAGNSQKIDVVFNPAKDVNTNLTWSVSDTSIIKVSKDGVLTGVTQGDAVLHVIAEDIGGAGITTQVHVEPKPVYATDFVLSPDKETIHVGDVYTLEKSFSPSGVTETNLTWDTSDANIATVDEGVVTAKAVGEVVISAVYTDAPNGKPITRSCSFKVEPPIVYATDFSVSPASENILVGGTFNINPVFTPTDTTNKNVDYQSLDTGVATVDNNGVVKGVGAGDVLIVCVAEDGGFRSECAVHVENAIQFSLNPSVRELAVGHSFTPVKVTKPSNASKTAKWKSSNTAIATVNSKGKVKGKRIGTCTITCTLTNYNQSAKCIVKVRKLNSKVKFDKTNIRIGVGQTYTIKRTVWSNASTTPKLSWKTSNKRILTVNSSGKIKGIRVGLAKITAITKDKIHAKAVCNVRVIRRAKSIGLNTDYMVLYVGRSKTLTARFRPSNATVKKVKWTSGNSKIARVTGSGKVRGISVGDTYITATATDGSNKKAKCYVKVLEAVPATSIVVAQKDMTMKRGDSAKLSFTVLPSDTSDGLKFSSNNKRVATINSKGVVHAVGTGDAEITILTTSGITANVNINVVALNKKSIKMRQYDSETLTVFGAKNTVTWYSSNKRVATVDNNGLVVGKGKGTAYIYAYVNGCKLGCRVTITSVNS